MKLFVTGCLHGEWDLLCDQVETLLKNGEKLDFIIVTGDAQTMRYEEDLLSYAAPEKYRVLGSFYKLYTGERKIPLPTLVVGGNHEASDLFHLLPFGGWLAPNVFYAGRANSLLIGSLTVTSISGLYKSEEYFQPVNETFPLRTQQDIHTCYHIRAFSDFQLYGLTSTQIMLSHDWPSGVPSKYGGKYLQRRRRDLIESDNKNQFGLDKGLELQKRLKPGGWFASHHHITFNADINGTSFHALPKPTRPDWFLVCDIEGEGEVLPFKYRGEWISILKATCSEMADPSILKNSNWDERWNEIKPTFTQCDDCPVGDFELNPYEYTAKFCTKHNIYCPVKEIRDYMETKFNKSS